MEYIGRLDVNRGELYANDTPLTVLPGTWYIYRYSFEGNTTLFAYHGSRYVVPGTLPQPPDIYLWDIIGPIFSEDRQISLSKYPIEELPYIDEYLCTNTFCTINNHYGEDEHMVRMIEDYAIWIW